MTTIHQEFIKTNNKDYIPIYYTLPITYKKQKNTKIIIIIEEIFGVNNHIKNLCKRLSKKNYISIAPELFFRLKKIDFTQNIDILRKIISNISDNNILLDIKNVIEWSRQKYNTNKIGITGFCWGGRITWLYTSYYNNFKTAVIWYGKLINNISKQQPIHPLHVVHKIKKPVLGLYGDKDNSIPLDTINQMINLINYYTTNSKILIFKNAQHGFNADYRITYNQKIAKIAWKKMLEWFHKYI